MATGIVHFQSDGSGTTYSNQVSEGTSYEVGTSFNVYANPDTGWKHTGFQVSTSKDPENPTSYSQTGSMSFQVAEGEMWVKGFFEKISYSNTASARPTEGGIVSISSPALYGNTVLVTQTPNTGYTFNKWASDDLTSSELNHLEVYGTFTQPARNVTVYAEYTKDATTSYTITATASPYSNWPHECQSSAEEGERVFFRQQTSPDSDYYFSGWTVDGTSLSQDYNTGGYYFTMPAHNVSAVANYTKRSGGGTSYYTINKVVDPAGAGTITCSNSASAGSTVSISQTPGDEYAFEKWILSGSTLSKADTESSNSFTMPSGSVTLTAKYKGKAITWSNGAKLSVAENGYNLTVTLDGYAVSSYDDPVSYHLYKGEEKVGEFSNNVATCTITENESTNGVLLIAVATDGAHTVNGPSIVYISPHKTIGYFKDGNAIIETIPHYAPDGTTFIEVEPYYLTAEGNWRLCSLH